MPDFKKKITIKYFITLVIYALKNNYKAWQDIAHNFHYYINKCKKKSYTFILRAYLERITITIKVKKNNMCNCVRINLLENTVNFLLQSVKFLNSLWGGTIIISHLILIKIYIRNI